MFLNNIALYNEIIVYNCYSKQRRTISGPFRTMARIHNVAIVASATKCVVQDGPFSGMIILPESHRGDGDLAAKWLGLYEQELHPCLEDMISRAPSAIINLGACGGFYAIGLARAFPAASVIAFDVNETAKELLRRNAEANDLIGRIEQGHSCNAEKLIDIASRNIESILVCDIEGGEVELLAAPGVVEALKGFDALIECYDFVNKNATASICDLFYDTHDIFVISQSGRNPNSYPFLAKLSDNERWMLISENRPELMHWVYCRSRRNHSRSEKQFYYTTNNIMSVSRYLRLGSKSSSALFIGQNGEERCLAFGCSIDSPSRTLAVNDQGTYTLISEDGKIETVSRFDPLIWTCAYGADEYFQCVQLCLESLQKFGQYRGRVCIFSDRNSEETLSYVPPQMRMNTQVLPIPDKPSWMSRYDCAPRLPGRYGPYLYIDTDVIFDSPIANILQELTQSSLFCVSTETKYYPQFERNVGELRGKSPLLFEWFGLEIIGSDGRFNDRHLIFVNSGIFAARDIGTLKYICDLVRRVASRLPTPYVAKFTDQAVVNYVLMQTGEWDSNILTPYVNFATTAPSQGAKRLGFYHFCWARGADKFGEMKSYLNDLVSEPLIIT